MVDLKGCLFRKADKAVEVGSTDVVLELRFNTDTEAVQRLLDAATSAARSPFEEVASDWQNGQARATAIQRRVDLRAAKAEQDKLQAESQRLQAEVEDALSSGHDPSLIEERLAGTAARLEIVNRRAESLTRIAATAREDAVKDLRARLAVVVGNERKLAVETRTAEYAVVNEVVNEIASQLLMAQRVANLLTDAKAVERIIESVVAEAEGDLPVLEVKPVAVVEKPRKANVVEPGVDPYHRFSGGKMVELPPVAGRPDECIVIQ